MKVYVEDLLVKNCSCCDFCYTNSQGGVCKLTGHLTRYDEPLEEMRNKCPLQSLADYTKQVRKEVCEEIKDKFKKSKLELKIIGKDGYEYTESFLDQIQGDRQ